MLYDVMFVNKNGDRLTMSNYHSGNLYVVDVSILEDRINVDPDHAPYGPWNYNSSKRSK